MRQKRSSKLGLTIALSAVIFTSLAYSIAWAEEQCVKDAWAAFNGRKYKEAITHSDKCIDEFGRQAERRQSQLEAEKIPNPPTGKVSDAERNQIFERGLLNDVATAYFIKGRSAEFLYREGGAGNAVYKETATNAYTAACTLQYGRTFDPKGWFWSPCEASSDRLPIK